MPAIPLTAWTTGHWATVAGPLLAVDPNPQEGRAEMRATFYCDESGYTGTHWGDPRQPVFVHGGWLIRSHTEDAITVGLGEIRRQYDLRAPELKWTQLSKRSNSVRIFRDVFGLLLENDSLPFFVVADKDYLIAAKLIETYFDPAYNHHFGEAFTGAFDIKKELAESVVHEPHLLSAFSELFLRGRNPEAAKVRELASEVAAHFTEIGLNEIAATLTDFTDGAIENVRKEFDVDVWWRTPTAHTLWGVLQHLEEYLRKHALDVEIVHDELVRFKGLLDHVGSMFGRPPDEDVLVINGRERLTAMPQVSGLRLAKSKFEIFIQLADLLCGYLRTLTVKLKRGVAPSPDEDAIMEVLAEIFLTQHTWSGNMPEPLFVEFFRPMATRSQHERKATS